MNTAKDLLMQRTPENVLEDYGYVFAKGLLEWKQVFVFPAVNDHAEVRIVTESNSSQYVEPRKFVVKVFIDTDVVRSVTHPSWSLYANKSFHVSMLERLLAQIAEKVTALQDNIHPAYDLAMFVAPP